MSAAGACNYTFCEVFKPKTGVKVRTEGRITGFDYYESVYSPMITADFTQFDTGGSVQNKKGIVGTLKDALPIEGFEEFRFVITTAQGELNFKNTPMVITGSPGNIDEPQRQSSFIPMVSKYSIDSSKNPISNVYQGTLGEIVGVILKQLGVPESLVDIEPTSNSDKVHGNFEAPLDVILKLCKKSIPADGTQDPGYFFYETKSGFKFKSIHGLIKNGIEKFDDDNYAEKHTYNYNGSLNAKLEEVKGNDFKILKPPLVQRDQDQITALKNGVYNVRICTLNTLTHQYNENIVNLLSSTNLGSKQESPVKSNEFNKTYTYLLDPGETGDNEGGVSTELLNSPANYEPKANMRYSLLHSQLMSIQVPCNILLEAGDVIKVNLENITEDNKVDQIYNEHRSGFYLILQLCHHFDTQNSYTSMLLARDTYGLYTSKK
jgi:hypothetical protein